MSTEQPTQRATLGQLADTAVPDRHREKRPFGGLAAGRVTMVIVGLLLVGALLLRIDGINQPSLETRELHNALLAREYYLGAGHGLPASKQHVLQALDRSVEPVEPPLLDHLAALEFRLTGSENIWFPRLASALLWVLGGVFLFKIALRAMRRRGALVALTLYLFWPYGVLISRLYMPDPMMVALLLAGALTVIRYWEKPSGKRFAVACGVSALATVAKPGIALIFLAVLFSALAASQGVLRRTVTRGTLPLYVSVAVAPTVAYYVYGTYVRHFLSSEGDAAGRLQPDALVSGWFWRGWWHQLSIMLPFPQHQGALAIVPLAVAVAGLLVVRTRTGRAILAGLGLGYVLYALVLAGYTADNAYYALPLIPILALAIGAAIDFLLGHSTLADARTNALAMAMIVLIVAIGSFKSRPTPVDQTAIADYRQIGQITDHTTDAIIIDPRLRTPAMYWGWIVGNSWYQPSPGQDLPATGDPFPPWINPSRGAYLVLLDISELHTERRLQALTRNLPVLGRTARYVVFDIRGGRLARAAAR